MRRAAGLARTIAATALLSAAILGVAFAARSAGLVYSFWPPGEMIDIGGRRLRLVCEGPIQSPKPVVLFESGAFGFSGDWAYAQAALTAQGVRSCAYDRAGLGMSDPSPEPRDGVNVARDLERLLAAARIPGPYVLVGHSMAGARVHLFANRNPDKVAGLVLVDATPPAGLDDPRVREYIAKFTAETHAAAITASLGVLKLLAGTHLGDKIGLPPEQDREKRRQFASARYNRIAYEEVARWPLTAAQARKTGPLDPRWPVAVITAGVDPGPIGRAMQAAQIPPAKAARRSHIEVVKDATHNGLLSAAFAGSIVRGIDFVLDSASDANGDRAGRAKPPDNRA